MSLILGVPLGATRALLGRVAPTVGGTGPARLGALALQGALAEPIGPGSREDEVVHALWWLVVELADRLPLVMLLDDVHWADEVTLRWLRITGRRATDLPLALVVTARPAMPGRPHGSLAAETSFRLLA